jgi:hypothetical protein
MQNKIKEYRNELERYEKHSNHTKTEELNEGVKDPKIDIDEIKLITTS